MLTFDSCYGFTKKGIASYQRVFNGQDFDISMDPLDVSIATPVKGTNQLIIRDCATAKELAQTILDSLALNDPSDLVELLSNSGLWCWLAFVFRHQVFDRDQSGRWRGGEIHRWYPSSPNDWRKAQRHLIRMPVQLLASFGADADHLLCGKPSVLPDIREQLTSQQDMFMSSFQRLARTLYFDDANRKLKSGAGSKGPGSPRRLAQVMRQFDATWDLDELDVDAVLTMLPGEFDRFRPRTT